MKKLFISIVLLLPVIYLFSQNQNNAFNKPPVSFMSPDAATLGKYGTYNVNHYTGTPGISVPIYEVNDPGISIPISLNYDASGFVPNKGASIVGTNWSLTAGGAITRVVKGVPDEKKDPNPCSSSYEDQISRDHTGYIWGILNRQPTPLPSQNYLENLSFLNTSFTDPPGFPAVGYGGCPVPTSGLACEYNPDIFSFNFMGHSGTFYMGNDGQIKVSSDRRYKVDISGLTDQFDLGQKIADQAFNAIIGGTPNINTNSSFSKIVMTADDGYVFTFGGTFASLEASFSYISASNRAVNGSTGVITAWYLVKVVAPDGDEVNFDYGTYTPDELILLSHINDQNSGNWNTKQGDFLDIRLFSTDRHEEYNLYNGSGSSWSISTNKSLIKMAYLKSFQTNSKKVSFIYSRKHESSSNRFYVTPYDGYVAANGNNYFTSKLTRITIESLAGVSTPYDEDVFLVPPKINYDFTYEYFGSASTGWRLYLTQLDYNNKRYSFNYSRTSELPEPMTAGLDRWGFYNGQNSNLHLIGLNGPVVGDPNEYETNFTYTGQVRTANASTADIGLLQKITYPTSGTTEFEFESHRFKKILKRKVFPAGGNSMIPEWVTIGGGDDDVAGGVRIKKITSKSSPSATPLITEYKYIKDYNTNPNGPSSGLLTDYGVFRMKYDRGGGQYHDQLFDQNIVKASGISESHICYSQVVETKGNGSEGYTKYSYNNPDNQEFSEPQACPDNYYLGSNSIRVYATSVNLGSLAGQMKRLARYSDRSVERGKLFKSEVYSNGNTLLTSQEYEYNRDVNRFNEKTVGYERIYNMKYPDQTVFTEKAFFYTAFHLYNYHNNPSKITEKTFTNGQTQTQTTTFAYKGNANPLLTEKTITKSDGSVFKTKYFYPEDRIGDPEFPASNTMVTKHMVGTIIEEQSYRGTALLQTQRFIYGDATGNGGYKVFNTKTINNTISPVTTEQWMNISYYTDGTVKEFNKQNDFKTAYIWDYKKTMPIAEVKNVQSAGDIAYTSFETNETWSTGGYNQWSYNVSGCVNIFNCPTGSKAYFLDPNSITRLLDPGKQYVLSLWFNGSSINVGGLTPVAQANVGNWTYKEYAVTGLSSITITGSGKVDELRLYPKGAFMTTYTYQPLFGVMSQCDVNNRANYYAYDNSGRLTIIRDKDKNIVKKICYNYAGQPENCTANYYRNTEMSQAFTKNDCGDGYEGSVVIYTVPENTYGSDFLQEDANLKAQQDINFNGQAYANANGTCNCTVNSCTGVDKKCVNGICQTGQRKNLSATYSKSTGLWTCIYVYQWSDCSISQQYTEVSSTACAVGGGYCDN